MRDAKPFGSAQFDDKTFDGLAPQRRIGTRQVDQVGSVGQRMRDAVLSQARLKPLDLAVLDFRCSPLAVVLQENLDALAACGVCAFHRLVETARNRHVSAKQRRHHIARARTARNWTANDSTRITVPTIPRIMPTCVRAFPSGSMTPSLICRISAWPMTQATGPKS